MTNIVVLDSRLHRDLRVTPRTKQAQARHFVQVVVGEFARLAVQCPLFLSKDTETGAFFCGVMLGFSAEENLLLAEWDALQSYRPLELRRRPFYLAGTQLAIDLDDPCGTPSGERLFDEDGLPTDIVRGAQAAFGELRPGLAETRAFIEGLVRHGLLTPVEIDLAFDDGSQHQLQDLYSIDQAALQALPDAVALEWLRDGRLYLVHVMILSIRQVSALANRRNRRDAAPLTGEDGWRP